MVTTVAVVVGNPRANSRTRTVAERLVAHLFPSGSSALTVIELAEHQHDLFSGDSAELAGLTAAVAESDLVVFASPTYKATYTGLLKAFLDRYPADGLAGVVAIPVLTGGDLAHSMGPTHTLLPLLAELGAIVPGRGLYFVAGDIDRVDDIVAPAAARYRANIALVAALAPDELR